MAALRVLRRRALSSSLLPLSCTRMAVSQHGRQPVITPHTGVALDFNETLSSAAAHRHPSPCAPHSESHSLAATATQYPYSSCAPHNSHTPAPTTVHYPDSSCAPYTESHAPCRTPGGPMHGTPAAALPGNPASASAGTPAGTLGITPACTPAATPAATLACTPASTTALWTLLKLAQGRRSFSQAASARASGSASLARGGASLAGGSASPATGSARLATGGASLARGVTSLADSSVSLEGREEMEYDVVVVGAGPAGLAASIRLKQLRPELSVCVLEKGAQPGSHILSGNVFEPRALSELLPDWRAAGAPLRVPVAADRFRLLASPSLSLPLPSPSANHGNYVISLSELVRWLAAQAEELGVEVYPGIAGAQLLLSDPHSGALYLGSEKKHWETGEGGEGTLEGSCWGAGGSGTGVAGGNGAPEACRVVGVVTGDVGRDKAGAPKDSFQPGMVLRGRATLLAEGCRGSLSQEAIRRYGLVPKAHAQHQTYALGVKEVWQVSDAQHRPGEVVHTLGYPLDLQTYGGGFLYHMDENLVSLGLVVALDYKNPHLNIFQEFQKWKQHPEVRRVLEGGSVVQYGARALNEGGFQSIPSLVFPGGALVGCAAGFLNVPKIKGSHTAIKSGMLAAEALASAFSPPRTAAGPTPSAVEQGDVVGSREGVLGGSVGGAVGGNGEGVPGASGEGVFAGSGEGAFAGSGEGAFAGSGEGAFAGGGEGDFAGSGEWDDGSSDRDVDEALGRYPEALKGSWVWGELHRVRNVRPGFKWGLIPGLINAAFELFVSRGNSPWTLSHGPADHASLAKVADWKRPPQQYPKPDGVTTFDILTSVYRSSTNHNHDEPPHLRLLDPSVPSRLNLPVYGGPETKYCPAKVYEYVRDESGREVLQINAQNCLHCKACDIKDPSQNIRWTPPEGGGGPGYTVM